MEIIRKQGRNSHEILTALKLDALNPLSQEAAEEIERLQAALAEIQRKTVSMERVMWATLKQHGPFWVSRYNLDRAPIPPSFRMSRNAFNDDVKLEALAVDGDEGNIAPSTLEN